MRIKTEYAQVNYVRSERHVTRYLKAAQTHALREICHVQENAVMKGITVMINYGPVRWNVNRAMNPVAVEQPVVMRVTNAETMSARSIVMVSAPIAVKAHKQFVAQMAMFVLMVNAKLRVILASAAAKRTSCAVQKIRHVSSINA